MIKICLKQRYSYLRVKVWYWSSHLLKLVLNDKSLVLVIICNILLVFVSLVESIGSSNKSTTCSESIHVWRALSLHWFNDLGHSSSSGLSSDLICERVKRISKIVEWFIDSISHFLLGILNFFDCLVSSILSTLLGIFKFTLDLSLCLSNLIWSLSELFSHFVSCLSDVLFSHGWVVIIELFECIKPSVNFIGIEIHTLLMMSFNIVCVCFPLILIVFHAIMNSVDNIVDHGIGSIFIVIVVQEEVRVFFSNIPYIWTRRVADILTITQSIAINTVANVSSISLVLNRHCSCLLDPNLKMLWILPECSWHLEVESVHDRFIVSLLILDDSIQTVDFSWDLCIHFWPLMSLWNDLGQMVWLEKRLWIIHSFWKHDWTS